MEELFIHETRIGSYKEKISETFKELLEIRNVMTGGKIQYMGQKPEWEISQEKFSFLKKK